jgi:hypothetical protein
MSTYDELKAAGVEFQPCRYCHSNNLRVFTLNQFIPELGKRQDVTTVECQDCRANAPLNVWNSKAKPLIIDGKDYSNYSVASMMPITEEKRDRALEMMLVELSDMLAAFPRNNIDARAWTTLMIYAPKDLRNDPLLIAQLHEKQSHPFYEYTSTDAPRKSGIRNPPEGYGWKVNTHNSNGGFERNDFSETTYWYRTKEDAATDEIDVYQLPAIHMPVVTAEELRDILRKRIGPAIMTSSVCDVAHDPSAILNCNAQEIYEGFHGSGIYRLSEDSDTTYIGAVDRRESMQIHHDTFYYILDLFKPAVQIIANLSQTDCPFWIRALKKNGEYGNWQPLIPGLGLHLNQYEISEIVQRFR